MKALSNNENPYIAKVILENVRSLKDCIFLLENHLKANKIVTYYETNQDQDKITFLFAEEKIAFDFTKIIYNEKNRNFLYKNVKVNLSLEPNKTYLRRQKLKKKKKKKMKYLFILKKKELLMKVLCNYIEEIVMLKKLRNFQKLWEM